MHNTWFEETEQVSVPDMSQMVELSDWKFKTMANILRTLIDEIGSMQEQMDNVNREIKTPRKNYI